MGHPRMNPLRKRKKERSGTVSSNRDRRGRDEGGEVFNLFYDNHIGPIFVKI